MNVNQNENDVRILNFVSCHNLFSGQSLNVITKIIVTNSVTHAEWAQSRPVHHNHLIHLDPGLYKLFQPAIPDGRAWSKLAEPIELGEHREHREHGKDHQPDGFKHSIHDSKHSISYSKHSNCQPDDSKHSILLHLSRQIKYHNIHAWRT